MHFDSNPRASVLISFLKIYRLGQSTNDTMRVGALASQSHNNGGGGSSSDGFSDGATSKMQHLDSSFDGPTAASSSAAGAANGRQTTAALDNVSSSAYCAVVLIVFCDLHFAYYIQYAPTRVSVVWFNVDNVNDVIAPACSDI